MQINTVTIVGANGTMGRNVAAIFASFGEAKVYLVSRTMEKSQVAIENAYKSVKAESVKLNMIAADYSMLKDCVEESDLIFEACAETWGVKEDVHGKIAAVLKQSGDNTKVVCSGTSGLSITKLAELYHEEMRNRFIGMHFFNPPYNLTLCELIPTEYTDEDYVREVYEYLDVKLHRTAVVTKDMPAFLGNRIGFHFINKGLQLAEEYKYNGGIDFIDAVFGQFTGRNMAPLVTANFVGLDVHKAIVDNLYENTNDYAHEDFKLPEYVENLIKEGKLGRKAGLGLYRTILHDSGVKIHQVYDIEHGDYREEIKYSFPFIEEMIGFLRAGDYEHAREVLLHNQSNEARLCRNMLLEYIVYALSTTEVVGETVHDADDVMATGFGWCPPLAMIEAFGGKESFVELYKAYAAEKQLDVVAIENLTGKIEKSKYDYRRFIKAKK